MPGSSYFCAFWTHGLLLSKKSSYPAGKISWRRHGEREKEVQPTQSESNLQMTPAPTAIKLWLHGRPEEYALRTSHTTLKDNKTMFKLLSVGAVCCTAIDTKLATRDQMRQSAKLMMFYRGDKAWSICEGW